MAIANEVSAQASEEERKSRLTFDQLRFLQEKPRGSCQLVLPVVDESLVVHQSLRFFPKRRWVFRGLWQQSPVCFKVFFHSIKGRRDWLREVKGAQLLSQSEVLSPKLLFSAFDGGVGVVVYQWLEDASSLAEVFDKAHYEDLSPVLLKVFVNTVAQLHQHHLVQEDIHLDNFLVCEDKLFCVDVGSVIKFSAGDRHLSLINLAMGFVQFPPFVQQQFSDWLVWYFQAREWKGPSDDEVRQFLQLVAVQRDKRILRWLRKVRRSGGLFRVEQSFGAFMVCRRDVDGDLVQLLQNEAVDSLPGVVLLKSGRSASLYRLPWLQQVYAVKVYHNKTWWRKLRRAVQPTRASISWRAAHLLDYAKIRSPKPLVFYEKRFGVFRQDAFMLSEFVEGVRGEVFFDSDVTGDDLKRYGIERLAWLVYQLFCAGLSHGDMKWTNFIFVDNDWVVLDLDQLKWVRSSRRLLKSFKKDIERLLKNWHNMPFWQDQMVHALSQYSEFVSLLDSRSGSSS